MKKAEILSYKGWLPIIAVIRSSTGKQLIFMCPSCGRKVCHGAGGPEFGAGNGHRVAGGHGHSDSCEFEDGYILMEVEHKVSSGRKRKGVGGTRTRH